MSEKNNNILENDIDKCPKCSPQYDVGKVVESVIEHDNADTDEWIETQESREKELLRGGTAE